jgi:hypothetical protein
MSVIWGNSENIYSVRVLLLVTRFGHSIRHCAHQGGSPPEQSGDLVDMLRHLPYRVTQRNIYVIYHATHT